MMNTDETVLQALKEKAYQAAREGDATRLFDTLWNLKNEPLLHEILDHQTEEEGQSTTPLIIAARSGHKDVVYALLNTFFAEIEQTGIVKFGDKSGKKVTALWCATAAGHVDTVKLLVAHGGNVNHHSETGSTPLRAACFLGQLEVVKYLIDNGADLSMTDYKLKYSCLMVAGYNGHFEIVEYLLKKGADPYFKNQCGSTVLHYSAERGHLEIVELLTGFGMTMTKNDDGKTPLMIAALCGNAEVVECLTSLPECDKEDKVNAFELLGTSIAGSSKYDVDQAYDQAYFYFMRAMKQRYRNKNKVIEKVPAPAIPAYDNWTECKTIGELEAIRGDFVALHMECLTIRERIPGHNHPEVQDVVVMAGAEFADRKMYDKCINLWLYGLKLTQKTENVMRFPEVFADMIEAGENIEFSAVLEVFKHITAELESVTTRIAAEESDAHVLKVNCQDIIIACMYLLGIMLTISKNEKDRTDIHRDVYDFIRQKPALLNDFTPLHISCGSTTFVCDVHLSNIVGFPNVMLCKTLIDCGASVNATDNGKKTPLHVIAKCANTVSDTDILNEIVVCLIENGAHVDICNQDGKTAMDVATTDDVKAIIGIHHKLSLKCLAAKAVKRCQLQYKETIPVFLQEYVELH